MKNLLVLFALVLGTVCFTSCEKDEETVDPIVGTWENKIEVTIGGVTGSTLLQWVVKADETGQFTLKVNDVTEEEEAFTWSKEGEVYTFVSKTDTTNVEKVEITTLLGESILQTTDGTILASKVK